MSIPIGASAAPEMILLARRALVYLTVDWSVPERASRGVFFEAAQRLSADHTALGIVFYSLHEEAPEVRDFLIPLGLSGQFAQGSGRLMWLEYGRQVSVAVAAKLLCADGVVERTLDLWGDQPTGPG